jgi:hypothetical protein
MFFYKTSAAVQPGDRARFHSNPGTIEFVVDQDESDSEKNWYIQAF